MARERTRNFAKDRFSGASPMANRQIISKIAQQPRFSLREIMRAPLTLLRFGTAATLCALMLAGCDTVMTGLVGPSKQHADAARAAAAPPAPPPAMAAFVSDSSLVPGFAGNTILPPTLPMDDTHEAGVDEVLPPSSAGPHKAVVSVPLSSDDKVLAPLGSAANREGHGADIYFVLLVLSPAANDAAAMDKANAAARDAANHAVTAMGAAGISADHIQIAMATNPNVGGGEIRLYRR
jgi:hypothetical protein